jgi:hypothetical protein
MALAFLVMPLVAGIITLISLIPQFSTRNWIAVPAVITASRIDTMDTRDSSNRPITAHKLVLEYSYQLEGRTSIGTRVDAVNFGNRPLSYMEARLLEYPLGTTTTAYYNPKNSKQSVLQNRLLAIHAPLLIPVIPLIPWAFKFASDGLGSVKVRLFQSRHGGVRTWDDGSRTTIRLPRPGAFVFTVYVWFGLMLAVSLYFLLANMFALFDHSLWSAMNLYAATLPLAVIAGIIKRFVIRSGLEDISINHETREVLLPSTFGRPTGSAVHIDHIVAVQTSDVMRLLRGFGKRRMATQLTLITQTHKHILVIWPDARRADALGRYLAQVLNQVKSLPPHPGSEAPTPRR